MDPSTAWFAPPPPSSAPPTYGLNDLSSWMFGQHLVIPAKDLVDKVEEIMMEMMLRSRSFQINFSSPLLVMDDKGGEDVKD